MRKKAVVIGLVFLLLVGVFMIVRNQLSQVIRERLAERFPEGVPEGFSRHFAGGVFNPISMILLLIGSITTIVDVVLSPSKKENNGFRMKY